MLRTHEVVRFGWVVLSSSSSSFSPSLSGEGREFKGETVCSVPEGGISGSQAESGTNIHKGGKKGLSVGRAFA